MVKLEIITTNCIYKTTKFGKIDLNKNNPEVGITTPESVRKSFGRSVIIWSAYRVNFHLGTPNFPRILLTSLLPNFHINNKKIPFIPSLSLKNNISPIIEIPSFLSKKNRRHRNFPKSRFSKNYLGFAIRKSCWIFFVPWTSLRRADHMITHTHEKKIHLGATHKNTVKQHKTEKKSKRGVIRPQTRTPFWSHGVRLKPSTISKYDLAPTLCPLSASPKKFQPNLGFRLAEIVNRGTFRVCEKCQCGCVSFANCEGRERARSPLVFIHWVFVLVFWGVRGCWSGMQGVGGYGMHELNYWNCTKKFKIRNIWWFI